MPVITIDSAVARSRFGATRLFLRRLLSGIMGRVGVGCLVLILICAVFDPVLAPYNPIAIEPEARLQGPSFAHWLGTDQLGRDLLSRVIDGTRTVMGLVAIGIGGALSVGLTLGLVAGYGPRVLGTFFMLICDAIMSLPMMLFALALATILDGGLGTIVLIAIVFMTPAYFRVVRSQTLALKRADYVVAARAMSASPLRIVTRHMLPNMIGPMLVLIAMDIPTVIGIEASLSFLGQGVRPPAATWGSVLRDGSAFIRQAPHIVVAGGMPIVIATIGFTFLSEALRDALDPRGTTVRKKS